MFRNGLEQAEKAMALVIRPGAEKEGVGCSGLRAVAERQRPQALYHYGFVMGSFKETLEVSFGIECHNCAAAKIADQQVPGMGAKGIRRQGNTPGRVDLVQLTPGI